MYNVVANPMLYHCGNRWVVIDTDYNIISEHTDKKCAEEAARELNDQIIQENNAAIRLMEVRREFLECSKLIGIEKVWSDGMIGEVIEVCQQARQRIGEQEARS